MLTVHRNNNILFYKIYYIFTNSIHKCWPIKLETGQESKIILD